MSNPDKLDDRLAEAAREIYRTYGTNIQRYFDDLLGKAEETVEHSPERVASESTSRVVDGRKHGKSARIP